MLVSISEVVVGFRVNLRLDGRKFTSRLPVFLSGGALVLGCCYGFTVSASHQTASIRQFRNKHVRGWEHVLALSF